MQLTVDLPITLDDVAKSISEKATQKGLTEEKLQELLENDCYRITREKIQGKYPCSNV